MALGGRVASVNISTEKGTPKRPVGRIRIGPEGVLGDAHCGPGLRQVSILAQERIDAFNAETGSSCGPGDFAENVTVRDVDLCVLAPLDLIRIGASKLQVTQLGKRCHGDRCAIFQALGRCAMPEHGVFARVVSEGAVYPGDPVEIDLRPYHFRVVTLSDRAHCGEYEDLSGPAIRHMLERHASERRRPAHVELTLIPDDAETLAALLRAAAGDGVDAVITTGSTGVGPRDIAPEVAEAVCDRSLPGIMETVRVKYGLENPRARLSRGIAGVSGVTQVYTLPGSVKAVREYMSEILLTLDHVRLNLHGLDDH